MAGLQRISESLYHALCMKVGTRQQVCMRRDIMDVAEITKNHGQPDNLYRFMTSGSTREGFTLSGSDVDTMFWFRDEIVIYDLTQIKDYNHLPNKTLFLMRYEQSPPGFALLQLLLPTKARSEVGKSCVRLKDRIYISSTLYRERMCSYTYPNSTVHGPCGSGSVCELEYDDAHCFKCDFWPQSALPMIQRCQNWPPLLVLYDIYSSGCHVVAKGSALSPHEDKEWRISFSQAEQKLVYAMNHSQFLVYGLLKLFLKEVINHGVDDKLLCSYFMKTVVFWEIKDNKIPCWCPQNVLVCFWSCFKHIIQWVYHGHCPNFFISQNNMFSGKVVGNRQHNLFQQLYGLYKQGYTCLLLSPSVRSYVVQVLCNPTIIVNVDEETFRSVAYLDIELSTEVSKYDRFKSFQLNCCLPALQTMEHLIQTPLTKYNCIMLQKLTSDIFKIIPFHLLNRCREKISTKMMYITDRSICHMPKLAVKFGSISDMLYIVMYYYRTCRYTEALSVIKMTKVKLTDPCDLLQDIMNSLGSLGHIDALWVESVVAKVLKAKCFNVLNNDIVYINELRLEQQISLTNGKSLLRIPSHVLLHMLSVLCYNHVDIMRRQQALNELYVILHHGVELYANGLFKDISYQILGLCQEVCGDRLNALHSYQESLRQDPFNKIQRATHIRIQHALEQLYT